MGDSKCDIDCDFIVDYLYQDIITNAPPVPGGQRWKKPLERITEQMGSNSNKDVFRLLRKEINVIKGDVGLQSNSSPIIYSLSLLLTSYSFGAQTKSPAQKIRTTTKHGLKLHRAITQEKH